MYSASLVNPMIWPCTCLYTRFNTIRVLIKFDMLLHKPTSRQTTFYTNHMYSNQIYTTPALSL